MTELIEKPWPGLETDGIDEQHNAQVLQSSRQSCPQVAEEKPDKKHT
jgi:hypothetical protein